MEPREAQPMESEVADQDVPSTVGDLSGTERGKAVAGSAAEEARSVAGTATEQAKHVAEEAGDQVRQFAQEARHQIRSLGEQGKDQLRSQAQAQAQRASDNLRMLSKQARALAEGRADEAGPLTDYIQDMSARLSAWADRLDSGGFQSVISDIQRFARRRPGTFIGLCAVAGFAVSRVGKSITSEAEGNGQLPLTTAPSTHRLGSGGFDAPTAVHQTGELRGTVRPSESRPDVTAAPVVLPEPDSATEAEGRRY
jgi:hypothetical protein